MDTQLAPSPENYAPSPNFTRSATVRENDFAQLIASGMEPATALVEVGILRLSTNPDITEDDLSRKAKRLYLTTRIQERIAYYHELHRMGMTITAERVLQETACIAYSDFAQLFTEDGEAIQNPHDIPRHLRAAIKEWGYDRQGQIKIKLHDKLKGIEMMGDMAGLFNDAHAAKAPQVTVTLEAPPTTTTIDVAHDCLA